MKIEKEIADLEKRIAALQEELDLLKACAGKRGMTMHDDRGGGEEIRERSVCVKVNIIRFHNNLLESEDDNPMLESCPICGRKAYVSHMVVDGFEFGWDAGCPTAKRDDGVHGVGWDDEITAENFPRVSYLVTRDAAIKAWNEWVSRWTEKHKSAERKESVK